MGYTTYEKARMIRDEVFREYGNKTSIENLKMAIRKLAGGDNRTIDRYIKELQDYDWIDIKEGDTITINNETQDNLTPDPAEKIHVTLSIPQDVKDEADKFGLPLSKVMTEGILDKLDYLKEYANELLSSDYTEDEIKYMWELVINNLANANKEENNKRLSLYRKYVNELESEKDYEKALETLRKEAVDLEYKLKGSNLPEL